MRKQRNYNRDRKSNSSFVLGTVFVIAGLGFLFRELFPEVLPYQLFTWQILLIIIGLVSGFFNKFKGNSWWILILIGAVFSSYQLFGFSVNLKRFVFPGFMILLGLLIFNKSKIRRAENKEYEYTPPIDALDTPIRESESVSPTFENGIPLLPPLTETATDRNSTHDFSKRPQQSSNPSANRGANYGTDTISINSYFASNERIITSKDFKGGSANTAFASSLIDLHNADFEGVVILDVFCIFGSVDLIIPNNWCVKNEVTALLGSVEDSRRNKNMIEPNKVLVIKGTVIMGSLEIKH